MLRRVRAHTDGGSHQTKLFRLVYAVLLSCSLAMSILITSASSVSETQTIPSSGMIKYSSDTLFETGFEAGDLSDVFLLEAYGGKVDIETGTVHSGTYSARCRTWPQQNYYGGKGQGRARVAPIPNANIPNLKKLNQRIYINVASWNLGGTPGNIEVMEFSGHPAANGGAYMLGPMLVISDNFIEMTHCEALGNKRVYMPFNLNTWYCLELEVNLATNGYLRGYVNDQLVIDYGVTDTTSVLMGDVIDRAWAGIVICWNGADYYEMFVDDYVISESYIGEI